MCAETMRMCHFLQHDQSAKVRSQSGSLHFFHERSKSVTGPVSLGCSDQRENYIQEGQVEVVLSPSSTSLYFCYTTTEDLLVFCPRHYHMPRNLSLFCINLQEKFIDMS